jgi:hypothetical protein
MDLRSIFPFDHGEEHPEFVKHTIDGGGPLKVINIGAGYTGLMCCIRIPRKFKTSISSVMRRIMISVGLS